MSSLGTRHVELVLGFDFFMILLPPKIAIFWGDFVKFDHGAIMAAVLYLTVRYLNRRPPPVIFNSCVFRFSGWGRYLRECYVGRHYWLLAG